MSKLVDAFNRIVELKGTNFTWERPGEVATYTIKCSISNYHRNLQAPEELVVRGREFVISYKSISSLAFYPLKRGDRLVSSIVGVSIIQEINPMLGLKGEVLGFRVRTD